jgi:RHS repeat-associated protein
MVFSGATDSASNWVTYSYDPWGKRVLQYASAGSASTVSTCVLYFYGANGKRLGTYNCGYSNGQFVVSTANVNVYFGKKLIASGSETNQNAVMTDRLGSVRGQNLSASIAYYPYGEERTSTPDNTDKFATYFRDGFGQDYADQRYYTSNFGRFWSVDPAGLGAAHPNNPISWNHYAYAAGDPVNFYDPVGQDFEEDYCGGDAEDPCPADGDAGGGNVWQSTSCSLNDDGTVNCITVATVSDTAPPSLALVRTPPGIIQIIEEVLDVPGLFIGGFFSLFLGSTSATDTISGNPSYYSPEYIEANCTQVGLPVKVPSTNYPGGLSIEQEYICPDGNSYTIHILTTKSGIQKEKHSRPGKPKYGSPLKQKGNSANPFLVVRQ